MKKFELSAREKAMVTAGNSWTCTGKTALGSPRSIRISGDHLSTSSSAVSYVSLTNGWSDIVCTENTTVVNPKSQTP